MPQLDRAGRKFQQRTKLKMAMHADVVAVGLEDVPPGSLLSDQTVADIAAGKYSLVTQVPFSGKLEREMVRRRIFAERPPIRGTNPHPYKGERA